MRHSETLGQLFRFGIAGGGVAVISVFAYWLCAVPLRIHPMIANFISYAVNVGLGFTAHRNWSFKRSGAASPLAGAAARYFVISLSALAMNSAWVWLLTGFMRLAPWTPILPMVFATPLVTFFLNRVWVFEARETNGGVA